jgi:hypothetical protein
MARRKKELWYMCGFVLLPFVMAILSGSWTSIEAMPRTANRAALDDITRLAIEGMPPSGAPLIGPESAPRGAPLGGVRASSQELGNAALATPVRTNSSGSWDVLKQIDGNVATPRSFQKDSDGSWTQLTFAALSGFKYELPQPETSLPGYAIENSHMGQIPQEIRSLDGVQCLLAGFMVPLQITRDGKVSSFALTQDQQLCCFGIAPAMNEWVMVTMVDGHTAIYRNDEPVVVYGQFAVGEEIDGGHVISLYRMKSTKVVDARELLRRNQASRGS